ncbi:tRNA lysidine(34) synthetase TilS [bacterium]|nr:tRNA lysidine(34) synthetase TilS [Candidatus Omnitrophota bacterium]MBU2527775.1 tRNA lysidine(34) synthetase TilS [bacterium]MBU3930425.1 tRNA lysidine(34) synthetase TilS [bacterium]
MKNKKINFEKQTVLKFLASCKENNIAARGEKILLAVSGGSDSIAMLALASKLKNKIAAAYIDHRLRNAAGDEKAFVKNLAKKFKIPFYTKSFDVAAAARSGKSLEDCAREARYKLLGEICKKRGFETIFTGHTLSDNTETFFLKLFRGGGISSFYGIARKTKIFGVPVTRPLLDFERDELKKFLAASKLPFMTDESNKDRKFLRNRIRRDLIPFIKKRFGKSVLKHLSALESQAEDLNALVKTASEELEKKSRNGKLDNSVYLSYNKFLRKCFLAEFLGRKVNSRYIDKIDGFISSGKGGVFELRDMDLTVRKGKLHKRRKT